MGHKENKHFENISQNAGNQLNWYETAWWDSLGRLFGFDIWLPKLISTLQDEVSRVKLCIL